MLPSADLDHVERKADRAFQALGAADVVITGHTGFVGSWMLESGRYALLEYPVLGSVCGIGRTSSESWHRGGTEYFSPGSDIRELELPAGTTHVIHCANAGDGIENAETPDRVVQVITEGTRRVAEECARVGARMLHVSSGSVYDNVTPRVGWGLAEGATLGGSGNLFAQAKLTAELYATGIANAVTARGFAFYGPRLPSHLFAADCMARALRGDRIDVTHGDTVRTYLYAADMAWQLWYLLAFGAAGQAYNVGSTWTTTLGAFAGLFGHEDFGYPSVGVQHQAHGLPFVPITTKFTALAGEAFTRDDEIQPRDGLRRWYAWERGR